MQSPTACSWVSSAAQFVAFPEDATASHNDCDALDKEAQQAASG